MSKSSKGQSQAARDNRSNQLNTNNAAYWHAIEDELARRGRPHVRTTEIEFRAGLELTDAVDLIVADTGNAAVSGFAAWLCSGGDVRASVLVGCEACSTT